MRRNAVLLTVLFAFAITLGGVTYIFWQFYKNNRQQYIDNIFNKYNVITQIYREHMMKHSTEAVLEANLAVYGLVIISGDDEVEQVIDKGEVLKRVGFQEVFKTLLFYRERTLKSSSVKNLRATMLEAKGKIYFYLESSRGNILLRDDKLKPYFPIHLISAYLTILFVIALAIFMILQRIRPLRTLTKKAMRYAEGDRSVSFRMKGQNEIAILANEMERARQNINALIESRTLFMRNVMHELKTPIAKGRISAEMVQDSKQKLRFQNIFIRLEQLINELAMIEEASSGFGHKNVGTYRVVDLVDQAIDQSMIDPEKVKVEVDSSERMQCDFTMMATVIKNLIDNGIKYSPNKQVCIRMQEGELLFENRGEKLRHPLRFYVEPFTKEHPARNSFGLGLYLVDAILQAHGMQLAYEHEEGINRFYITSL